MTVAAIRALVERHTRVAGDDAPLEVDSLTLVAIVEDLEAATGIRVRASELRPEHFGSITAIAAFIRRAP